MQIDLHPALRGVVVACNHVEQCPVVRQPPARLTRLGKHVSYSELIAQDYHEKNIWLDKSELFARAETNNVMISIHSLSSLG